MPMRNICQLRGSFLPSFICGVTSANPKARTRKIGIIAGVGDRRDEDIRECATIAARMFDHIIIRQEKHLRGRTEEEIIGLIMDGINASGRNVTHEIITKEVEAIKHAINSAQEGTFITALSDVVTNAIEIVQEYLDKENEGGHL